MFKPKRNKKAAAAIAIMDDAIQFTSEKWYYFNDVLKFKTDVELKEKILTFFVPASQGLRNNFKPLTEAPDAVLLMIVAKGVERSKTHTTEEIEAALGLELPD